jgi:hypothetical protein
MNKQEIISNIEVLNNKIKELQTKEWETENNHNNIITEFWNPILGQYGILDNGFYLECNRNYFNIKRKREGENYGREMITISSNERYIRSKDEEHVTDIETSFYTTSENSIFELERMIVIGKVAQLLLDKKEELISQLNTLTRSRKIELSDIFSVRWEYERQVKEFNKLLDVLNVQEAMDKLREGVTFERTTRGSLPRLRFRGNDESAIKSLKITSLKGKSASIEYTSNCTDRVLGDTIRVSNIESFVQYYKDVILKSENEIVVE